MDPGELVRFFLAENRGNTCLIADSSAYEELLPVAEELKIQLVAYNENVRDILANIHEKSILVICSLDREESIYHQIQEDLSALKADVKLLRLVRDLFRRYSYHLGQSLKPEREWKSFPGKIRGYIIFAQQRTGSTLLSNILKKTRKLGNPQEHLQDNILQYFTHTNLDFREWLEGLFRFSFTTNGFSGTKIITTHFLEVMETNGLQAEDFRGFLADKKIIYLRRMNRLRQAISYAKARRSGVWHIREGREIRAANQENKRPIDAAYLDEIMEWIDHEDRQMVEFFLRAGIRPLELYYEDLADASTFSSELKKIRQFLSPEEIIEWTESDYFRMADDNTEFLVRKYYQEKDARE